MLDYSMPNELFSNSYYLLSFKLHTLLFFNVCLLQAEI